MEREVLAPRQYLDGASHVAFDSPAAFAPIKAAVAELDLDHYVGS
jgi:hypothetical protein